MKKLAIILAALLLSSAMLAACAKNNDDENLSGNDPDPITDESTDLYETDSDSTTDETTTGEEDSTTDPDVPAFEFTFKAVDNITIYTYKPVNLHNAPNLESSSAVKDQLTSGAKLLKVGESNEIAKDTSGMDYKLFKVKLLDKEDNTEYYIKSTLTTIVDPDNIDAGFTEVSKTVYTTFGSTLIGRLLPDPEHYGYTDTGIYTIGKKDASVEINVVAENTESGWYKISYEVTGSDGMVERKYCYLSYIANKKYLTDKKDTGTTTTPEA